MKMKKLFTLLIILSAVLVANSVFASEGEALFKKKPCVACHTVDTKMVGPALSEVAAKNAGVADAIDTLALHIKNGSSGLWGPVPMPPNAVTEEEAKILAEWVLSLK